MTMESTELRDGATGDRTPYPLDPLTGSEIESAAAIITDSEYSTATTKFVMIQLAEPAKNPELTFEDMTDVPRRARTSRNKPPPTLLVKGPHGGQHGD